MSVRDVQPWSYGAEPKPAGRQVSPRALIIAGVICLLMSALLGVMCLNASKTTCSVVGCFGWCADFTGVCGGPPPGLPGPGVYGPEKYGG